MLGIAELGKLVDEYTVKIEDYNRKFTISGVSNFNHLVRNMVSIMGFCYLSVASEDCQEDKLSDELALAEEYDGYLRKYFSLLDEFPKFREDEFGKPWGYLGQGIIASDGLCGYISESERRLKAVESEQL